ncbi:MAG: hypothetical protein NUV64_00460 [Parcubacteria group bacterium]|nr:hypothetical protein [Parcubacteria group bacterium]MCR4342518.1 hypothetical protein [Patescibacteria group bacterium]
MKKHFLTYLLITFISIIGIYLTVKATHENSWDGWGFGSAQTMMSIKHWVNDGWTNHYFLFIPAGYSKTTHYFDDPNLKQHAWVDVTGGKGTKQTYYTHYPSGYLFPLAFLMELGFENRFWFRLFQILISMGSLFLLYKFFILISNKAIAFFAVLFYMISVPFLDFADSLANMPIDDFFRFIILFLSVLAIKNISNSKKYFTYSMWAWLSYFVLSVSSYDSTFFVFFWLIGLDILIVKNFPWKKWLLFSCAPVLAFGVQVIQNSWYLGFYNMLSDFFGAFNAIPLASNSGQNFIKQRFLQGILFPITEAFAFSFRLRYALIFIATIVVAFFKLRKIKYINSTIPDIYKYAILLGGSAFFQSLILTDNHPYKGRILGVFAAFIAGIFIFMIYWIIKKQLSQKIFVLVLISLSIFMWSLQTSRTFAYIKQWPNNTYEQEKIDFAYELKNSLKPFALEDTVIFTMFPPEYYGDSITPTMTRYYDMYYHDMPILYFDDKEDLVRDFTYLKQISEYPFSALIILPTEAKTKTLIDLIYTKSPKDDNGRVQSIIIKDKKILIVP